MRHQHNEICPIETCRARCAIVSSNRYMTQFQCKGEFGHLHKVYKRYEPPPMRSGDLAARREPFPFRELRRDPFALMNLAMEIRR